MGWMNRWRSSDEPERGDPLDETVIHGAPYDPYRVAQRSAPPAGPQEEIPEAIKQRQTALLVAYVRALRAR